VVGNLLLSSERERERSVLNFPLNSSLLASKFSFRNLFSNTLAPSPHQILTLLRSACFCRFLLRSSSTLKMEAMPSSEASGPPRNTRDTAQKTALLVQETRCAGKDSNQAPPGCKSAAVASLKDPDHPPLRPWVQRRGASSLRVCSASHCRYCGSDV
jgi:hypothetical protein